VRLSVIVKQKNGGTQHSMPFVLNCMLQLLQPFTLNSRVYCCALGQNSTKRTSCLFQNTVHMIFLVEKVFFNFFLFTEPVCDHTLVKHVTDFQLKYMLIVN